jgi:hypothetical protein
MKYVKWVLKLTDKTRGSNQVLFFLFEELPTFVFPCKRCDLNSKLFGTCIVCRCRKQEANRRQRQEPLEERNQQRAERDDDWKKRNCDMSAAALNGWKENNDGDKFRSGGLALEYI